MLFPSTKRCWTKLYTFFSMKIPNKWQLQQITFNHLSDIALEHFMSLYKKCTAKPYSFLVIETTPSPDNSLGFRHNFLERIWKQVMMIEDKIRDEKLHYNINREAAKISALSLHKIDKYEHLAAKEILPFKECQIVEQAKHTYSLSGKALEKQTETIEEAR